MSTSLINEILRFARDHQQQIVDLTRRFVECESPSHDRMAVDRMTDLAAGVFSEYGTVKRLNGGQYGRHLRCEFRLPGRKRDGAILILGHTDTVWPCGTLRSMPFRRSGGRLWGPGVLDMKSGLVFCAFAVHALIELNRPVTPRVILQLNSDEEVGSPSSRPHPEEIARRSESVLVLEFGTGTDGKLKTS